ncbi:glycerate kinase [Geomicrobium sp. JCM 19038]|uniref:glycerate kinase n=1 Tax=Geomicrobium sp. JCM 19038 TaxID=1460635 RepID=UPI00045F3834|nr:glycerate kinase [Geomicrobium sp. JCM 19038]GAK09898.1 glycerate kinase [Geomicrobium sp. JCM 19038]
MVHLVIAPDSFKESMTAEAAAHALARGFRNIRPNLTTDLIPMGDGGEGTMEALTASLEGTTINVDVEGPNKQTVTATYALSKDGKTAIMDMASASGIHYNTKENRNVLEASTYGTGELIRHALDQDITKIIIGIGGSATNDGGAGMIEALGATLLDKKDQPISRGGAALKQLVHIDTAGVDSRLHDVEVVVACDVKNPLLGPEGASAIYGPQKGATVEDVEQLDAALANFHNCTVLATGNDVKNIPGAGAAGGLGAGLLAYLDAKLVPGIELVLEETNFKERVKHADLVLTGEGKIDGQSIYGKTPVGVALAAKEANKPVIAVCGALGEGYKTVYEHGIDAVFSIVPGAIDLEDALANGEQYLEETAENIARVWKK